MARSFRSPVWSFFDQPQPSTDGKSETVCKLCKKTFAYHGGTLNLQAHLERKHPHSFEVKSELQGSVEKSATRQKAQRLITQHAIAKPSATACSEPRKNAINDLITDWLVADLRPLSIVTREGFLRLFSFLEPGYTVPCGSFFTSKIQRRHEVGKVSVKNELAKASGICLSTDIWTSRAAKAYNTATVHFIDGDWSLRTGVLETASFPGSHAGVTHTHARARTRAHAHSTESETSHDTLVVFLALVNTDTFKHDYLHIFNMKNVSLESGR